MTTTPPDDETLMGHALALARRAADEGEVPVGAILVSAGCIVGEGWNRPIAACDPTAHAEILVLRAGAAALGAYRLPGTTLVVTLEPCPMCVGAMIHARVERVVFGASDPKTGALGGALALHEHPSHNHRIAATGGVRAEASADLLRRFFRERRRTARQPPEQGYPG